jgi:UPF0716 protein FxsA
MALKLLLAFILIPAAEIYFLVKVGGYIGVLNTLAVIILVGLAGAYLARIQGSRVLGRIREHLQHGRVPPEELMDAFLILIAGILLVLPGFFSDLAGLFLLFRRTRQPVKRYLAGRIREWFETHTVHINYDR